MTTKLDPKQQQQITDDAAKAASATATTNATKAAKDEAASAAKTEVESQLKTAFGVTTVTLDELTKTLKTKLLDDAIEFEHGTKQVKDPNAKTPNATVGQATHRYTIFVPDKDEQSVLNMGHGDTGRDLPDPGISARTTNHVHLHTTSAASSSFVALGGPTKAKRDGLIDPKSVLAANKGIGAVTNGHFWAEAQGQLNLASYTDQAALRAHKGNVRVQSDASNVELGAGKNVALGGVENVKITAHSSVSPGDNAYGTGFGDKLIPEASALKDAVTFADFLYSVDSVVGTLGKKDSVYQVGHVSKDEKNNDIPKLIADSAKAVSTAARYLLGKAINGQVKIVAENFASTSATVGASMYGGLSATVSSLLSASVVGGTASVKGLKWASMWAKDGVSVRTRDGTASLKSDTGKVNINGNSEVSMVSEGGLNMGGDKYAELKSLSGYAYVAAPKTKICAGEGDGMGLLLDGSTAFFGTVSKADEAASSMRPGVSISMDTSSPLIQIDSDEEIKLTARGSKIEMKNKEVRITGKKTYIA